MAIITKAVVQEATSRGIERLDELTDEKNAELMPSENTIKKAIEDWQATTDLQNKDDFQAARRVFSVNDAGNKKNWKLTHRLMAAYNKGAGKVILRFIACGSVAKGELANVVAKDMARLGVCAEQMSGSCTDSAPDVLVTFVNQMAAKFPGFIGAG